MSNCKKPFFLNSLPLFLVIFVGLLFVFPAISDAAAPDVVQQACRDLIGSAGSNIATFGLTDNGNNTYTCTYPNPNPDIFEPAKRVFDPDGKILAGGSINTPIGTLNEGVGGKLTGGECSILNPGTFFQECIWFPLMSWLGSWFLTIGGVFLRLVGALFDILIQHIIIGFGQTLNDLHITKSIEDGWTLLRDVANIIIIGLFVFIAIAIILGLKEFGQKKLVANVIIIAVLLNFSLLFTRLVIDFSNFTAYQFYQASAKSSGTTAQGGFDIANAFLSPMGLTNIWDTKPLTDKAGQTPTGKSATTAFFYGLVGGIMLFGVAAVLAYGCYVIALRGILFLFLMLTAAAAFATFLIPNIAKGSYGWSSWWKALLNAAIFAPLLMIFLFISLQLITTAGNYISKDALNTFIVDPKTGIAVASDAWKTIFNYVIVLGLLFASFKISSKIASSVPGSDLPMKLGKMAASTGLSMVTGVPGLAGGGIASLYGRMRYGRAGNLTEQAQASSVRAGLASDKYKTALKEADDLTGREKKEAEAKAAKYRSEMASAQREAQRLATRAERIAQRAPAAAYGKRVAARIKLAAGAAKRATPSQDAIARARDEYTATAQANVTVANARKDAAEKAEAEAKTRLRDAQITATEGNARYANEHNVIGAATVQRDEISNAIKEAFSSQLGNVSEAMREGLRDQLNASGPLSEATMRSLREEITKAVSDPVRREQVRDDLARAQSAKASLLRDASERIETARDVISSRAQEDPNIIAAVTEAQQRVSEAREMSRMAQADALHAKTEAEARTKEAPEVSRSIRAATREVIGQIGRRGIGVIPNLIDDEATAKKMMGDYRSQQQRDRRLRNDLRQAMRDDEST